MRPLCCVECVPDDSTRLTPFEVLLLFLVVDPTIRSSPACAGSHTCKAVKECAAGVLRNPSEGRHDSASFAEET